MVLRMEGLEPLSRYMGVDGGCGNVRVPQQHLHCTQIGTMIDQMGRKGVTQGVR